MDELDKAVTAERDKAEAAATAFLAAVEAQVTKAFPERVKSWVTGQPLVTKRLGDRLSVLKREADLVGMRVRDRLSADQLWRHRVGYREDATNQYNNEYRRTDKGPPAIEASLNKCLADLSRELSTRFEYVKDETAIAIDWSALDRLLETYARAYEALVQARRKRDADVAAKQRAEAAKLWDGA